MILVLDMRPTWVYKVFVFPIRLIAWLCNTISASKSNAMQTHQTGAIFAIVPSQNILIKNPSQSEMTFKKSTHLVAICKYKQFECSIETNHSDDLKQDQSLLGVMQTFQSVNFDSLLTTTIFTCKRSSSGRSAGSAMSLQYPLAL